MTLIHWCLLQEYGEVEGRGIRMAKRVVRALALIIGCVFIASLVSGFSSDIVLLKFSSPDPAIVAIHNY